MAKNSAGAAAGCGKPGALLPEAPMSSASEPQESSEATPSPEPERPVKPSSDRPNPDRPKKKKLKAKAPPPPPLTEDEIDSPTRQTLGMLGVIGIMTLCMWVFARGGCNYHPPKESRDPRKVELAELARDPKDAALEFELRFMMKSFGGALELAKGPMLERVKSEQASCDKDPGCSQRASDLRGSVLTTAHLLERDPFHAAVRVITTGTGAPQKHIIKVERDGQIWKAVARDVDDGSFKPKPQSAPLQRPDGSMLVRQPGMPGTTPPVSSSSSTSP
jgi:hypothetical protein